MIGAKRCIRFFVNYKKNLYDVLQISKTATLQQIKAAYYKKAQIYHPDKNPDPRAKQIFDEIKNAYQILTQPSKKQQYDDSQDPAGASRRAYNSRGPRASGFRGGENDPFEQYFKDQYKDKGFDFYENFTSTGSRAKKGEDIVKIVNLGFIDSIKGTKINLQLTKQSVCEVCQGSKCKPGTAPTRCMSCGGSGTTTLRQGSIILHLPCTKCKGMGLNIKNPCLPCNATGIQVSQVNQTITIPSGVNQGQTLKFPQMGNKSQNGPPGDLYVQISVTPDKRFRRSGMDIESTEFLTISQAVLGYKGMVQTIYGPKQINFPAGCQDGEKIHIKNLGVQKAGPMMVEKGDHIVVARIKIPKQINSTQRQLFQEISKYEQKIDPKMNEWKAQQKQQETVFEKFKNIFK